MKKIYIVSNNYEGEVVPVAATFDEKQASKIAKSYDKKPAISQEMWNYLIDELSYKELDEQDLDCYDLPLMIKKYVDDSLSVEDLIKAENYYERDYLGTTTTVVDFYE